MTFPPTLVIGMALAALAISGAAWSWNRSLTRPSRVTEISSWVSLVAGAVALVLVLLNW